MDGKLHSPNEEEQNPFKWVKGSLMCVSAIISIFCPGDLGAVTQAETEDKELSAESSLSS